MARVGIELVTLVSEPDTLTTRPPSCYSVVLKTHCSPLQLPVYRKFHLYRQVTHLRGFECVFVIFSAKASGRKVDEKPEQNYSGTNIPAINENKQHLDFAKTYKKD